MPKAEQVALLRGGVAEWNEWKRLRPGHLLWTYPDVDLSEAGLQGANLQGADLAGVNLRSANLAGASLAEASLARADLEFTNIDGADFSGANLNRARLAGASGFEANFSSAYGVKARFTGGKFGSARFDFADLRGADFTESACRSADFTGACLLSANFERADISDSRVYGAAAWEMKLDGCIQRNLVVTPRTGPMITVDDLQIAQFVFLLLDNDRLRRTIGVAASKLVLLLGRFADGRRHLLDALAGALRERDLTPVICDFKTEGRTVTETVTLLAHVANFVIADITDARSVPHELAAIVPHLPSVKVQPILRAGSNAYAMLDDLNRYPWFLPVFEYQDAGDLLKNLDTILARCSGPTCQNY